MAQGIPESRLPILGGSAGISVDYWQCILLIRAGRAPGSVGSNWPQGEIKIWTLGAPGTAVGAKAKRHAGGWPRTRGAPCHSRVVCCLPIIGGGEPRTLLSAVYARIQDTPTIS